MTNSSIKRLNEIIGEINADEIRAHMDTEEALKEWCEG